MSKHVGTKFYISSLYLTLYSPQSSLRNVGYNAIRTSHQRTLSCKIASANNDVAVGILQRLLAIITFL